MLRSANEKITINIFANELRNTELRSIVKTLNYSKFSDANRGAVDEQPTTSLSQQILNMGNFNNNRSQS